MNDWVKQELLALRDEEYLKFHRKLLPSSVSLLGVRIPDLRKLAKTITKEYGEEYVKNAKLELYEEVTLYGLVLSLLKLPYEKKKPYLDLFVLKIDNWATCDIVAGSFLVSLQEKEQLFSDLLSYQIRKEEYIRRFSIVMLFHYLEPPYLEEVLKRVEEVEKSDYYVSMAVAWLLSIFFIKYKERFLRYFIEEQHLDRLTYQRTIQKILDSTRVSKEEKDFFRTLKK